LINLFVKTQAVKTTDLFSGREVVIATMHGKGKVIEPVLQSLGMRMKDSIELDTDQFGTFSGEIERIDDPLTTLRNKCIHAREHTNIDLVIASEGSFGAHPLIPYAVADEELLMLKDFKNDLEIVVKELSTETNFDSLKVQNDDELAEFANKVGFPHHALILRTDEKIEKGIKDANTLQAVFTEFIKDAHFVHVETDMRAMNNPSRMRVIERVATKLKIAIESYCPECHMPDFTIKDVVTGLPCSWCGLPTNSIRLTLRVCKFCGLRHEMPVVKNVEDPMYCNHCNP
jgi:hypothetical protein